ncbi:FAD-dependent oxidoreductase [Nonomuraea salmonea]|uniref:FAD-dependent oxidoreductase n=1 Tax=Nonomuraea salmonea TaxID=46181 RepID=UPI0031E4E7B6
MATTSCDVAIVGAGLGGCFLALLLGRRGQRVVVIEQGPSVPSAGADFLKPPGTAGARPARPGRPRRP